ncbi:MAG: ImmA/IrrE family metallo-endopeptidase [Bacteroidales bacterium]|jgi:hypothetical protein|nr:ImmA/IrrE family metallo-endopeptidase [Bacteroidales bacterium]
MLGGYMKHSTLFKKWVKKTTPLTGLVVDAAWPEWWSESLDGDEEAHKELRRTLSTRLGLAVDSLDLTGTPRFVWDDRIKYKNFRGDLAEALPALSSFGMALTKIIRQGMQPTQGITGISSASLRQVLIQGIPFIQLETLLKFLWSINLPVLHLQLLPLTAKYMCGMTVHDEYGYAIFLAKNDFYPAALAFYLAHEIGHIALGHIGLNFALVDVEASDFNPIQNDEEELAADQYALELLTGVTHLSFSVTGGNQSSIGLAKECLRLSLEYGIEPATIALCYGFESHDWRTAQASLRYIYTLANPAWQTVNDYFHSHIDWGALGEHSSFVRTVILS